MNVNLRHRKPPLLIRRSRALRREVYWRLSAVLPIILAAEFPKSGGSWIAQMVASAAGFRFPRNNLAPYCWKSVLLGHHLYSRAYDNVFAIFRDGRDVMVSAYHHFLFENEWNDPRTVISTRQAIGYADQDRPYASFDAFVEWMFTDYCRRPTRFSWSEFVQSWIDVDVPKVRYERMLSSPSETLHDLCTALEIEVSDERIDAIVEENSFKAQAHGKRVQQGVSMFARKGIAGDWKNVFDRKSADIFNHYAGRELIALGYEPDDDWLKGL